MDKIVVLSTSFLGVMAVLTMTSTEAQTRFGELLDTVQREPISVTRRGRVLAVILSPEVLEKRIEQEVRRQQATAAYAAYCERVRPLLNPAVNELTDENINQLVHELR